METLLLSIHPRHSKNILEGRKLVELRKRPVDLDRSRYLLIYETLPMASIVGYCQPFEVVSGNSDFWCTHVKSLCLNDKQIKDYLGAKLGYGIKLMCPQKITPIPLTKLRELGITPPQSYRYLSSELVEKLGVSFHA